LIRERKQDATNLKKRKPGEKGKAGAPARDGSGAAAFLYRTVSAFLGYAEAQGWIAAHLLPRRGAGLIAPPPPSRTRVLSDADLAAVWRAADREPPKLRAFVRLLILSGAREKEVADMTTGEIDLAAGRWILPGSRTKNRIGYVLPLSPLAVGELAAVWPVEDVAPSHCLLGRSPGSGFRGFGRLKLRIDACLATEAAKIGAAPPAPWRWHDLRRSARTGMARLGVPRDHAEAAINHISGRSTLERTYDLHDFAPEVIAALTQCQGHVAGSVEKAAEVVPLASRRRAAAR
jgi:integrase